MAVVHRGRFIVFDGGLSGHPEPELRALTPEEEAEAEAAMRSMTVRFSPIGPSHTTARKTGLDQVFWQRFARAMNQAPISRDQDLGPGCRSHDRNGPWTHLSPRRLAWPRLPR
jgi:hypothetical protein